MPAGSGTELERPVRFRYREGENRCPSLNCGPGREDREAMHSVNYAAQPTLCTIVFSLSRGLALCGGEPVTRDDIVWRRAAVANSTGSYALTVPAYDSALLVLAALGS